MTFEFRPPTALPLDLRPFAGVLDVTEDAFVLVGRCLEDSVRQLQDMVRAFGALDAGIGAGATDDLDSRLTQLRARDKALDADYQHLTASIRDLRRSVLAMRSDVRDLALIVQLVQYLSVSARIQGNSLSRAHPQIQSFVARLGELAEMAGRHHSQIDRGMGGILSSLSGIEESQVALAQDMRLTTFPAMGRFAASVQSSGNRQAALREVSQRIEAQMQRIMADVTGLITALQIGDTLRQRLEQAHAALALAGPTPAEQALGCRFAAALGQGAFDDSLPAMQHSLEALHSIRRRSDDIMATARAAGFASADPWQGLAGLEDLRSLRQGLGSARDHFAHGQELATQMRANLNHVSAEVLALGKVAVHLRMASINAVIAAAKLGSEGRAMRELAQWLRGITDDFETVMARVQGGMQNVMAAVEDLGDRRIAQFASDLGQFDALSAGLGESVETAQSVVRATADLFEQTAQMVANRTGQAHTALAQVGSKIGQTHGIIDRLDRQARTAEGVSLSQSGLQDYLSALRGKYTMAAERALHDALVADLSLGQAAPPLAPEPQAESAGGDDLDDIFF